MSDRASLAHQIVMEAFYRRHEVLPGRLVVKQMSGIAA